MKIELHTEAEMYKIHNCHTIYKFLQKSFLGREYISVEICSPLILLDIMMTYDKGYKDVKT